MKENWLFYGILLLVLLAQFCIVVYLQQDYDIESNRVATTSSSASSASSIPNRETVVENYRNLYSKSSDTVEEKEDSDDRLHKRGTSSGLKKAPICVVGNAGDSALALQVHEMWQGKYPSAWITWKEEYNVTGEYMQPDWDLSHLQLDRLFPLKKPPQVRRLFDMENMFGITSEPALPWTRGLEVAIDAINAFYDCEYIFLHDDDLMFYLWNDTTASHRKMGDPYPAHLPSINSVLEEMLHKYKPAIAGFLWERGSQTISTVAKNQQLLQHQEVSPLFAFDTGMMLYHRSILPFYIPFSPRGEGGLISNWTVCAGFLHEFIPKILREHAIQLNTLRYDNMINPDNKKVQEQSSKVLSDKFESEARHPYEYMYNKRYAEFLSGGLLQPGSRSGRAMEFSDLYWANHIVPRENPDIPAPYEDPDFILRRLMEIYDIRHSALSNNEYLNKHFTKEQLYYPIQTAPFDFIVIIRVTEWVDANGVIAPSLRRLWTLINSALKVDDPNMRVEIRIFVTLPFRSFPLANSGLDSLPPTVVKKFWDYVNSLTSSHGKVAVHHHITKDDNDLSYTLESWTPIRTDAYALFLQDTDIISPLTFLWTHAAIRTYFFDKKMAPRHLVGFQLAPVESGKLNNNPFTENHPVFLAQMVSSSGFVISAAHWRRLVNFSLIQMVQPFNQLPTDLNELRRSLSPFLQMMLLYLVNDGYYFLGFQLPRGLSLVQHTRNENSLVIIPFDKLMTESLISGEEMLHPSLVKMNGNRLLGFNTLEVLSGDCFHLRGCQIPIRSPASAVESILSDDTLSPILFDLPNPPSMFPWRSEFTWSILHALQKVIPFRQIAEIPVMAYNGQWYRYAHYQRFVLANWDKKVESCTLVIQSNCTTDPGWMLKGLRHYSKIKKFQTVYVIWRAPEKLSVPKHVPYNQIDIQVVRPTGYNPQVPCEEQRYEYFDRLLLDAVTTFCIAFFESYEIISGEEAASALNIFRSALINSPMVIPSLSSSATPGPNPFFINYSRFARAHQLEEPQQGDDATSPQPSFVYCKFIHEDGSCEMNYQINNKAAAAGKYSMISYEGMFIHYDYLSLYFTAPEVALKVVNEYPNCADLLLNFLVALQMNSRTPTILSAPSFGMRENGFRGDLHEANELKTHTYCFNEFVKIFGVMPFRYVPVTSTPQSILSTPPSTEDTSTSPSTL